VLPSKTTGRASAALPSYWRPNCPIEFRAAAILRQAWSTRTAGRHLQTTTASRPARGAWRQLLEHGLSAGGDGVYGRPQRPEAAVGEEVPGLPTAALPAPEPAAWHTRGVADRIPGARRSTRCHRVSGHPDAARRRPADRPRRDPPIGSNAAARSPRPTRPPTDRACRPGPRAPPPPNASLPGSIRQRAMRTWCHCRAPSLRRTLAPRAVP